MKDIKRHSPGAFSWIELGTSEETRFHNLPGLDKSKESPVSQPETDATNNIFASTGVDDRATEGPGE